MTVFPRLAGIQGTRAARQIRSAGAIHAGYTRSRTTRSAWSRSCRTRSHLALDALGALALAATPFVTGQWRRAARQWVPHVALCLFELGSLVLTDPTGRGDSKVDVDAVRSHNMEDPDRKVHAESPAVTPACA